MKCNQNINKQKKTTNKNKGFKCLKQQKKKLNIMNKCKCELKTQKLLTKKMKEK